ncbi:MAG: glucokinase, partial [Spirochaetia bacterium]
MILVGDIGGTNTTLATVEKRGDRFSIVHRKRYASVELSGMPEALDDYLVSADVAESGFEMCCLSGAGPVRGNQCAMTNVSWPIDGDAVGAQLGIRTFVINDFSAICYALPLIDTHDEIQTLSIPHLDGSRPKPHGPVRVVVGAGTGLGTGYLTEDRGHYTAHPSEGGHTDFAPLDSDMAALQIYLEARFPIRPGAEQFISGQGIKNIYNCYRETGRIPADATTVQIDTLPDTDKPGAVARQAATHDGLASVMRLFVRMFARYASNTALSFLPAGGLYLAGGIAAKNERWILEDHLFMQTFEENYNERVTPLLRSTPVVLIKDYSVSLYGAAHAAISLG